MSGESEREVRARPPRAGEEATLSDLAFRSKASHGYDAVFMEACRAQLTFATADLASLAVVDRAGVVVGVVGVEWPSTDEAEISHLWVDPDHQGGGVGGLLVEHALRTARTGGARAVRVEADPGAVTFYTRVGFVTVGAVPSRSIPGRRLPLMRIAL